MSEVATKALSVRAPWWWYILHAGKDIENRTWSTNFRGTVYLHASKWWRAEDVLIDSVDADQMSLRGGTFETPGFEFAEMKAAGGCIVGTVDVVDCVRQSASPWCQGDFGFVLRNPVAFAKPVPCRGMQRFFTVPDDVLARIAEANDGR
jgi:hypothetical protein